MRLFLACFLLISTLVAAAPVRAENGDLKDLAKWVGKYPSDKIDGKTVWDNKDLKELISLILTQHTVGTLYDELSKGPQSLVEKQADLLMIFTCREHACLLNAATLFVDLKKQQVSICWRSVNDGHDAWLENGRKPELKKVGACDEFEGFDLYKNYYKDVSENEK